LINPFVAFVLRPPLLAVYQFEQGGNKENPKRQVMNDE
jgi:hypothetical protein